MDARAARRPTGAAARPGATSRWNVAVDVAVEQPGAGRRDEQRRRAGAGAQPVAQPQVGAAARSTVVGCSGSSPGLAELAVADGQHARASRSTSPRSRRIASPTRIPVTASSPIRVCEGRRAAAGTASVPAAAISAAMSASEYRYGVARRGRRGQQVRRRHLARRVEGVQVGGEAAHHRQPVAPTSSAPPPGSVAHASASSVVTVAAPAVFQVGRGTGRAASPGGRA